MVELLIFDCDGVRVDSERLSHGVLQQMRAALRTPHCVAANGNRRKVEFTLGHTGLLPRFAGRIISADDVQHPKPAPGRRRQLAGPVEGRAGGRRGQFRPDRAGGATLPCARSAVAIRSGASGRRKLVKIELD